MLETLLEKDTLKNYLQNYVEQITCKSKGNNMYVCPLCGSGNGQNGTGAFSVKDGTRWKCFSCNAGGDLFDLIGLIEGISDYSEQHKRADELFGLHMSSYNFKTQDKFVSIYKNQNETSYRDFFMNAHSHITETDYPKRRGLSEDVVNRFKLGYVPNWRHPKALKAPTSPRLIIPTSPYSYLARDTREKIPEGQKSYSKSKVGKVRIFNSNALYTAQKPVFIVEGEIDALSIIEVGGEAIALGSVANKNTLITMLESKKPVQSLIVALDNDESGEKASNELIKELNRLNIPCYKYNPAGEYKDANEALQNNREVLSIAVAEAEHIQDEINKAKKESYLKTSAAYYLQSFVDGISSSVNTPYIPTGFENLDNILDGGLYEGLYVMGAISSLGKTTIMMQIADQIAQSGEDVLIFSLEMARYEIMAKSISRHTVQTIIENGGNLQNAKTSRGITTGKRYLNYNDMEIELINNAIQNYSEYAHHIYISEGMGNIGVEQIRETIKEHIMCTNNSPVVIVDYLQILAPYNEKATDKQNMDKSVMELKRISRDYKIPVIGISSFNRGNYTSPVNLASFKESGAIEYSSDVLLGLQLKGTGESDFDINEAKKKHPREIELVILKNRNGRAGDKISFTFYPLFNYFIEGDRLP